MPTATRAELIAAVRRARPDFASKDDDWIEAHVGAADPRYRELFDRARGALPPTGPTPVMGPGGVDPRTLENNSPGEVFKERLLKSMPLPGGQTARAAVLPFGPKNIDEGLDTGRVVAPTVGGAVGTMYGGPLGAIGTAGLASAGYEKLRQMIQRARGKEDLTPEEADWQMKKETLIGAGSEGLGQGIAKGFEVAAPHIYRLGANIPLRLRREFPTVVQDAIEKGVALSDRGAARAIANREAGEAQAMALVQGAHKAGAPPLDLVEDVLNPTVAEVGPKAKLDAQSGNPQSREALIRRVQDIQAEFAAPKPRPTPVPEPPLPLKPGYEAVIDQQAQLGHMAGLIPSRVFEPTTHEVRTGLELGHRAMLVPHRLISGEAVAEPVAEAVAPKLFKDVEIPNAQDLKQRLQLSLDKAWRAEEAGHQIDSFKTEIEQALERQYRQGLESRVEGLGDVNKATQRDIGVQRMVENTLERNQGLTGHVISGVTGTAAASAIPMAVYGHPLAGLTTMGIAGLTKLATSPYLLSNLAIGLNRTASPAVHASAYRAMAEALRQQLEEQNQSETQ
jgi:hypothetical protein